jgi:hypothetical protein
MKNREQWLEEAMNKGMSIEELVDSMLQEISSNVEKLVDSKLQEVAGPSFSLKEAGLKINITGTVSDPLPEISGSMNAAESNDTVK